MHFAVKYSILQSQNNIKGFTDPTLGAVQGLKVQKIPTTPRLITIRSPVVVANIDKAVNTLLIIYFILKLFYNEIYVPKSL